MANEYLKLPLRADLITGQKQLSRCTLYESVAGMVQLITLSHFDENKEDCSFGNELWEYDFETIDNIQAFKDKLTESIRESVSKHEKRLTAVRVTVGFEQVLTTGYNRRIRQKIHVSIEGTLRKTNEPFAHQEVFFMGPLSYY